MFLTVVVIDSVVSWGKMCRVLGSDTPPQILKCTLLQLDVGDNDLGGVMTVALL